MTEMCIDIIDIDIDIAIDTKFLFFIQAFTPFEFIT